MSHKRSVAGFPFEGFFSFSFSIKFQQQGNMDFQYPQGYDKMETYLPCLCITTNHEKTHKSLLRLSRKADCQIASCSLYFSKTKWVLVFQKSGVDTKQLMEVPNCMWVSYFYRGNTGEWMTVEAGGTEA